MNSRTSTEYDWTWCSECGQSLPLDKSRRLGESGWCTDCCEEWHRSTDWENGKHTIDQLGYNNPAARGNTPGYFRYSALKGGNGSIRLVRLLPGRSGTALKCELFNANIKFRSVTYEALSYTWGDPTDTVPIVMNDKHAMITRNLHEALESLRRKSHERIMWIDAICIDQNNVSEKNIQLRRMQQIYSSASQVIMWIGEATEDSDLAFDQIEKMSNRKYVKVRDNASLRKEFYRLFIDDVASATALLKFSLLRPYWRRAWIVQEVIYSQKATVVCGHRKMPWTSLYWANISLYRSTSSSLLGWWWPISSLFLMYCAKSIPEKASIVNLLWHGQKRECLDPRDRVYAFIGLPCEEDTSSFTIDYSLSVEQVYISFALWHIRHTRTLNVLGYAALRKHAPSLNSWVPDWRDVLIGPEPIEGGDKMLGFSHYRAGRTKHLLKFTCSERRERTPHGIGIALFGVSFDRIKKISPEFSNGEDYSSTTDSRVMQTCLSMMQSIPHDKNPYTTNLIDTSDFVYTPFEGHESKVQHKSDQPHKKTFRFPPGHTAAELTIIEAFWRTLVRDCVQTERIVLEFDGTVPEDRVQQETTDSHRPNRHFWPIWQYWYDLAHDTGNSKPRASIFQKMILGSLVGRCFITTENGYMGLVRPQAKVGDLVVTCVGSTVPHILREMDPSTQVRVQRKNGKQDKGTYKRYQHQGDCYVHGIMHGEAMEDFPPKPGDENTFVVV